MGYFQKLALTCSALASRCGSVGQAATGHPGSQASRDPRSMCLGRKTQPVSG